MSELKLPKFLERYACWLPILSAVAIWSVFFAYLGVRYGGDTPRYLTGAERFLKGLPLQGDQNQFLGYILFVATMFSMGFRELGIIVVQVIFTSLAGVAIYDMGRRIAGELTGVLGVCLFIANLDVIRWSFYLLTDSLFISLLTITFWAFYRAVIQPRPLWRIALVVFLMLGLATIRPNGWILLPLFAGFFLFIIWQKHGWKFAIPSLAVIVTLAVVIFGLPYVRGVTQYHPLQMLSRAEGVYSNTVEGFVIWGYPENQVTMPLEDQRVDSGSMAVLSYCWRHVADCTGIFLRRAFFAVASTRPFYSFHHNLALILVLPFLYFFAMLGFISRRMEPITWLIIAVIILHLSFIAITHADSDGRFWAYVLPIISLYSAVGFNWVLERSLRLLLLDRLSML